MMCKKLFYLVSVFVLSLACTSYADLLIGDFEGDMGNWVPGFNDDPLLAFSDIGVTSGAQSLALTVSPNGFNWALQWNAPEGFDLSGYHTVSADVTWVASEWAPQEGIWVQFQLMAVNSGGPSGWKQSTCIDPVNPDYPGSWDPTNWGDQTRTVTWDISQYDSTGTDWLQIIFATNNGNVTTNGTYYIDNVMLLGEGAQAEPTVPFSVGAVGDITIDNGPRYGHDGSGNGSGLEARDVADRRHVFMLSYDISALKGRGPVSNVSLNSFSHDQHGEVNVYGVIEDLDLLDVESLTWNTAPGVKNDPAPELNTTVTTALDMNELTDVLVTFSGPGETGVRFSTDTSDALADFINSDTDGIITLLVVPAAEGNQLIVRSREHSAGGTLLEGEVAPIANIIWVADNLHYDFAAGLPADHGFVELLRAQGYLVDYKGEYDPHVEGNDEEPVNPDWLYWRELDADKIAELNAADLVIIARDPASSTYDDGNEPAEWNSITTPMIMQSAHIARTGGKWGWFNTTGTTRSADPNAVVIDAGHPIFAGVNIDPNTNIVEVLSDGWNVDWPNTTDVGNGMLLATRPDGVVWITEWAVGQEYFEGSGQFAGGPRMFFASGSGGSNPVGDGTYNLSADGETMFLNAVNYMLPAKLTHSYTFEDGTAADSVGGADGALVGDAAVVDGSLVLSDQDQWMEMPGDVIAINTYDAVTLEAWYTPTLNANGGYTMLASFGLTNPDATWMGVDYLMITSARGDDLSRAAISCGNYNDPWASESLVNGPEYDDGLQHHMVATVTATEIAFYIDGELMGTSALSENNHLENVSTAQAYLGKAPYGQDPEWIGSIQEFNIYDKALSAGQVAANYAAGLAQ